VQECPGGFASTALAIANQRRAENGLPALNAHPALMAAARQRSYDQASRQTMSHDGWVGTIQSAGYPSPGAENVAAGQSSPDQVMSAWWGSDGHRANLLNGSFHDSGVGCMVGANGVMYWTQDFG
jgi:uncharacterized protein YkwD